MSDSAVRIEQPGGPEVLRIETVQVGDPGPGEIRIRHHACGLNYIDIYHRSGVYPLSMPSGLGMEGAGIVEAVGEGVTHLKPGDRAAYASNPIGAYASARVMPARCVVRLPDFLSFEQGAAMMLKGMTVQYLLRRTLPPAGLQAGDHVLFHAAAGGVGLIACQWAKALGLQLIGTAGSDAKCRLALDHGAAFAINYATENVAERVKEITGGQGVKVVYDSVGASTWEGSLASLRPFGLMVSFGNASGVVPPVPLSALAAKGLYLTRPSLFTHLSSREVTQEIAGELFKVVERGAVRIEVENRYPFDEVQRAHREMEARTTTGSSVLLV
ncbi:MAG: quinone oxidoreductase [Mitsuaria chitosanitabida]|uniref:quinone oxidoreductase family protein n=1 Tax=Roseateles chitosanitabidus TaxID=65048 RepID=UPI001B035CF9|nr:quinone oxidoreductase [Roseateles chitosanitabidus]MBO9686335.1 quinone oxidoreductase [Roseateles chitosanitabidus]